jgi:hypothetical protein
MRFFRHGKSIQVNESIFSAGEAETGSGGDQPVKE